MKIFLTGGSGYVGRNIIRYFVDKGHQVIAIARSEGAAKAIEAVGGSAVRAVDMQDVDGMKAAAKGCDVCVHSAADISFWAPSDQRSYDANVTGTLNVIAACRAAEVKRFIHISTENVLVTGAPLVNADETHPYPPVSAQMSPYARTKHQAEVEALAQNGKGVEVIVLRPRLIWGEDDTTVAPVMAQAVHSGKWKWVSGGNFLTSSIHVLNLCFAIQCAIEKGKAGEIYFVSDGKPVNFKQFNTDLLVAYGVPAAEIERCPSVSLWLAWYYAQAAEYYASWMGGVPTVSRGELACVSVEITVNDAKARAELGYHNLYSVEEGIQRVRDKYLAQGKSILKD